MYTSYYLPKYQWLIIIGWLGCSGCTLLLEDHQRPSPQAGEVAGELSGEVAGEVAGEIAGEIAGDLAGEVAGDVAGDVGGEISGDDAPPEYLEPERLCEEELACGYQSMDDESINACLTPLTDPLLDVMFCRASGCVKYRDENSETANRRYSDETDELEFRSRFAWWRHAFSSGTTSGQIAAREATLTTTIQDYNYLPLWMPEAPDVWNSVERQTNIKSCQSYREFLGNGAVLEYSPDLTLDQVHDSVIALPESDVIVLELNGEESSRISLQTCESQRGVGKYELKGSFRHVSIDRDTKGMDLRDTVISGLLEVKMNTEVTLYNVDLQSATEVVINNARVIIDNTQPEGGHAPLNINTSVENIDKPLRMNIDRSVIVTNSTLAIGRLAEDATAASEVHTVTIKDSTIVMTDPTQPIFELFNANLVLDNVLLVTGGAAMRLTQSTISDARNFKVLAPPREDPESAPVEGSTLVEIDAGSRVELDVSFIRSHQETLFKVAPGGSLSLKHLDVSASGTLVDADLNVEEGADLSRSAITLNRVFYRGLSALRARAERDTVPLRLTDLTAEVLDAFEIDDREAWIDLIGGAERTPAVKITNSYLRVDSGEPSERLSSMIDVTGGLDVLLDQVHLQGGLTLNSTEGQSGHRPRISGWWSFFEGMWSIADADLILNASSLRISQAQVRQSTLFMTHSQLQLSTQVNDYQFSLSAETKSLWYKIKGLVNLTLDDSAADSYVWRSELSQAPDQSRPIFQVSGGSLDINKTQLTGHTTPLKVSRANGSMGSVTASQMRLTDDQSIDDAPRDVPLIHNGGAVTLQESEIALNRPVGAILYNGPRASALFEDTLLVGPALYGVYLDTSSTLETYNSLIDLKGAEDATALYLGETTELKLSPIEDEDPRPLQALNKVVLFSSEDLAQIDTAMACRGVAYQGVCAPPIEEGDLRRFTPCSVSAQDD